MWFLIVSSVVFVGGLFFVLRWMTKWRDPSWDSEEGRAKAELWSKRGSGGGRGM